MKIYKMLIHIVLFLGCFLGMISTSRAQGGDQILDGIGETEMVARYLFKDDLKDWSRNNLHATHGAQPKFVNDKRFGKVLSLSGENNDFVLIPGAALADMESLSISGWIFLRSNKANQRFFDFGRNSEAHFTVAPQGITGQPGYHALITAGGGTAKAAVSPTIALNKWVYLTIVVDMPSRALITYLDGKPVGKSNDIPKELSDVFGAASSGKKQLYLGKSLLAGDPNLDAMVRDFRIYRVPLTESQVFGIFTNAQQGNRNSAAVNVKDTEGDLPSFPLTQTQLYNAYLLAVSDVSVETEVGELPRLPSYVNGTYKDGIQGPKVRVLWPSPNDNSTVLEAGGYTVMGQVPGTELRVKAVVSVKGTKKSVAPSAMLEPFSLSQVSLETDAENEKTKFIENRDKFIRTLATTDPNSFLYMFRNAFGMPQPAGAEPLGVWDSQDTKLRGHATGHYLTAIAQAYSGTAYDKALQQNFADKMTYMVNTLFELSQLSGKPKTPGTAAISDPSNVAPGPGKKDFDSDLSESGIRTDYWNWGKGFISAYPPDQFIMLEKGAKYGGQVNQVWAPYYTLHKILAGLIDIYEVSGNKKALDVAEGMANWVYARLSKLPEDTLIKMWHTYIAGEFGGMNETMAHLYRITKQEKYLKTARMFDNIEVFFGDAQHSNGLAKNVDTFRGLHANQHIPQIVGSIVMYDVSKMPEYYKVADNFWYKAVNDYMYSIGGVAGARNPANAEVFTAEPATLYENGFAAGGQNETCATYNLLKLTSNLFLFDQRAAYMDYYERGLYNHILASVAENSPANTYHVPLRPGSVKQFGNPDMKGFTCCNGTAIESSTKLQSAIYFKSKDDKALYVNLFIPSTLNWTSRNVVIEQTTSFPKDDHSKLTIKGNGQFDIYVRVPGWATKGYQVSINGKAEKVNAQPGSYVKLSRNWKAGDEIALYMPFQFRLDPVMDQQNIASLFYGPILLAAQEPAARKDWRKITLDAKDIGKSIQGDPKRLEFTVDGVRFKPFYDTYGRHSVYLDVTLN
ncbi:MAG: hypothetical protein K0S24_1561 [Sphingobacterium sp.]|jgi:DUF1680 family protein|nr:hypothetical protein [Sphingobacterium sp.]